MNENREIYLKIKSGIVSWDTLNILGLKPLEETCFKIFTFNISRCFVWKYSPIISILWF